MSGSVQTVVLSTLFKKVYSRDMTNMPTSYADTIRSMTDIITDTESDQVLLIKNQLNRLVQLIYLDASSWSTCKKLL